MRPALFIGGATHDAVDFTLRISQPCLLSPLVLPRDGDAGLRRHCLAFRLRRRRRVASASTCSLAASPSASARRVTGRAPLRGGDSFGEASGRDLVVEVVPTPSAPAAAAGGGHRLAQAMRRRGPARTRCQTACRTRVSNSPEMARRLTRNALLARLAAPEGVQELPETWSGVNCGTCTRPAQAEARLPPADIAERAATRVRLRLMLRTWANRSASGWHRNRWKRPGARGGAVSRAGGGGAGLPAQQCPCRAPRGRPAWSASVVDHCWNRHRSQNQGDAGRPLRRHRGAGKIRRLAGRRLVTCAVLLLATGDERAPSWRLLQPHCARRRDEDRAV